MDDNATAFSKGEKGIVQQSRRRVIFVMLTRLIDLVLNSLWEMGINKLFWSFSEVDHPLLGRFGRVYLDRTAHRFVAVLHQLYWSSSHRDNMST